MAKHIFQSQIKPFVQDMIVRTAAEMNLTKDEFAERLAIDSRSYAYIKSGETMCSATTLLIYLAKICPDPLAFLDEVREIINEVEENR